MTCSGSLWSQNYLSL